MNTVSLEMINCITAVYNFVEAPQTEREQQIKDVLEKHIYAMGSLYNAEKAIQKTIEQVLGRKVYE